MAVTAAAVVAFAATLVLFFPRSCAANDAPPGTPAPEDECPRASTLVGFVWPHMYAGFAVVPLLALGAAGAAGSAVAYWTRERGE